MNYQFTAQEFNFYKYNCKHQQSVPSCRLASSHQVSSVMSEFPLSPRHLTETLGSGPSPPQRFLRLLTPLDSPLNSSFPYHAPSTCNSSTPPATCSLVPPLPSPPARRTLTSYIYAIIGTLISPSAWTTSTLNSSAPSKFYSQDKGGTMESPLMVELAEI